MSNYFHGIRVVDQSTPSPAIGVNSNCVISVLGTVEQTPKDFVPGKPYLVNTIGGSRAFVGGSIGDALYSIFLQTEAQVVVCASKKPEEIVPSTLLNIKHDLDLDIDFCIAPGLESSFFAELKSIVERTKSILIIDLPEKDGHADEAVLDAIRSERVIACYPKVLSQIKDTLKILPLSSYVAGVCAKVDAEKGFWYSASNHRINGISGLSTPVPYVDDDPHALANVLNEKKILTVIRDDGFRVWGNSGLYDSNTPAYRFISVVRTKDYINRALKRSLRWAIDRGITRNLIDEITAKVSEFLAQLKMKGAIINGKVTADETQNTPSALVEGKLFFNIDFTPVFIAEQITFTSILTDKYLKNVGVN